MYAKLKKKYSQNFLIDKNITNKIINLIQYDNLKILEIGPGDGKLTESILKKKPLKFDLIEIDRDLVNILNLTYSKYNFINLAI